MFPLPNVRCSALAEALGLCPLPASLPPCTHKSLRARTISTSARISCPSTTSPSTTSPSAASVAKRGHALLFSSPSSHPPSSLSHVAFGSMGGHVAASAVSSMEAPSSTTSSSLPEVATEFMVDMSCEGCVKNVKRNLEPVAGVSSLDISLENNVVRITGTCTIKELEEALGKTGLSARLIGQGDPNQLQLTAAVAEFKGPVIHGVVRFTQVSMELARVEAQFDGLTPNARHGWSVNEYGDLTKGAASTGGHYNPSNQTHGPLKSQERHAGDLGNLQTNEVGHAEYTATNDKLKVWDLIGRAVVVNQGEDDGKVEGSGGPGIAAAVIARSAGVGENYKSLCTCDGTVIWEATNSDHVSQKA